MEKNLLLVDDEENILRALTRLLRRDGYSIYTASSGPQGLELLKQHEVSVIVSDQRMPEMSGVEFLSKARDIQPNTVRIVLSGYTDINSVTDAINRGAVYKFLTKPWEDDLLRENIREAFDQYELVFENERLTKDLLNANTELEAINRQLRENQPGSEPKAAAAGDPNLASRVLDDLPVGVMVMDEAGAAHLCNKAFLRMLGREGSVAPADISMSSLPGDWPELIASRQDLPISESRTINGRPVRLTVSLYTRPDSTADWPRLITIWYE